MSKLDGQLADLLVENGRARVVERLLRLLAGDEVALHSADVFHPVNEVGEYPRDRTALNYDLPPIQSDQAARIFMQGGVLEWALGVFLQRNAEYGDGANDLGVRGQFADINRKVIKLKRYMWNGEPVPAGGEDIERIAAELIGHLLLVLDMQTHFTDSEGKGKSPDWLVSRSRDRGPNYEADSDSLSDHVVSRRGYQAGMEDD